MDRVLAAIRRQVAGDAEGAIKLYDGASEADRMALGREGADGRWIQGPDFLIIGSARCGTSWLKKRLSGVRAIRILAAEPNYFSFHWNTDPRDYVGAFATDAVKNAGLGFKGERRLYGDKSPSYFLMSETKIRLLMALYPNIKIVCMVREPVERAWSDIRRRTEDMDNIPDLPMILDMGHFERHIERWGAHVAPENLHLIDYDDICENPKRVFLKTIRFLGVERAGVDASFPPPPPPSPEIPEATRRMLEAEYAGERWELKHLRRLANAAWEQGKAAKAGGEPPAGKVVGPAFA